MQRQFVWLELRASDVKKAKEFYGELFGWSFDEMPMGDGAYVMVKGTGAAKEFGAGMMKHPSGASSGWVPFAEVEDISASTKKAQKLGAQVVQDVMETPSGLTSGIIDPTGAALNLWQKKPEK